ncbi:MAG: crossover junction endodeoxyribonuclease RuvC [Bacteroidales bacterium]|nr:crossover junction endodeoxyribonuclease RuvC [Bacteroidales bacterium]MCF8334447.1 crossover junction endodeoxyribonuclease RuvC [Bacteroidales bacterium]
MKKLIIKKSVSSYYNEYLNKYVPGFLYLCFSNHKRINLSAKERIILGIDPGTSVMGYGIIRINGRNLELITLGVLKLAKINDHAVKLRRIFERTRSLIEQYHPDELVLEAPFYGKNIQSMLKLGRAQGVAMAAGLTRDIPIFEYSPRKIKQSITGNGNASKHQVSGMVQKLLNYTEDPQYLDATDGLATALCHYLQRNSRQSNEKSYSGWKSFISDNPDRVK